MYYGLQGWGLRHFSSILRGVPQARRIRAVRLADSEVIWRNTDVVSRRGFKTHMSSPESSFNRFGNQDQRGK